MAEKEKTLVEITEVPTQTEVAYKLPNGDVVSPEHLLLWIANEVWDIKQAVA